MQANLSGQALEIVRFAPSVHYIFTILVQCFLNKTAHIEAELICNSLKQHWAHRLQGVREVV